MNPVLFYGLAVLSGVVNVVVSLGILRGLQRRNVRVSMISFRLLLPWYVHQYGEMTTAEGGKANWAFYAWIGSINLAAIFLLLGIAIS